MNCRNFFHKWPHLCALAGMIGLAVLAGLFLRARGASGYGAAGTFIAGNSAAGFEAAGASTEVVYAQPLRAVHARAGAKYGVGGMPDFRPFSSGQAQAEAPRVDVPVDFYDFGPVGARAVVQRDFLVINRGSAPLVITRAYTTCGCTTADLSASVIPPGKASRVTVIFDAGFHPAPGQTVRRGLVLETNDPDHSQAEIWVQARVGR